MFLQQTIGTPWFAVQRASQVTMILLAVTMLVMPILSPQQEVDAEPLSTIICTCITIIGGILCVCLDKYINKCTGHCGRWGVGTGHERSCENGHSYHSCYPNAPWLHATCTTS